MKSLLPFLLAVLPLFAAAQTQRLVLLEHFTNASCPPCASLNPGVMANVAAAGDKVVVIGYHTDWPGVDPMNAHNPTDVNTRRTYYNITSVPNDRIDGVAIGSGNPAQWNVSHLNSAALLPSPYQVRTSHRYLLGGAGRPDSIAITVVAKQVAAASGSLRLHTVIIENEIKYASAPGTNGEKVFPHVMKKMLPSASGQTLPTLAVGDSVTYSYKWRTTNVYDMGKLEVISFVQNNTSKVVLQAGISKMSSPVPYSVLNVPNAVIAGATGLYNYNFTVETPATQPRAFKVYGPTRQVTGTSTKLLDDTGNEVDSMMITIDSANPASIPVRVRVTNGSNLHGSVSIRVRPASDTFRAFSTTKDIPMYSTAPILVVNRDASGTSGLAQALAGRGAYAITAAEYAVAPAELFSLRNYGKIILSTGNQPSDLVNASVTDSLTAFLARGGDLAIFSSELGYSGFQAGATHLRPFIEDILGASFLADGPGANGADGALTVQAISTDTVGNGVLQFNLSSASYDQLNVRGNGILALRFTNGRAAGIRTRVGESRTAYFAFPFQSVLPASNRNRLLTNVLNYFDGLLVSGLDGSMTFMPMTAAPNPASTEVSFYNLLPRDEVILQDITGRPVARNKAESNKLTVSTQGLASGLYIAHHVRRGAVVSTLQVSVAR